MTKHIDAKVKGSVTCLVQGHGSQGEQEYHHRFTKIQLECVTIDNKIGSLAAARASCELNWGRKINCQR